MKATLDIVPTNCNVVFIGLNPTLEAIEKRAVFSRDEAFWNVLLKAGLLNESLKGVPVKERAFEVFEKGNHSVLRVGFADLLPLESCTNSKNVKVPKDAAVRLFQSGDQNEIPNLKYTKKIALLGQKVVNAFAKDFNSLKKWEDLEVIDGVKQFGSIGIIEVGGNKIEVFAFPFPVNTSIPNKHEIYKKIL